jgi:hypothetical protein
MVVMRRRHWLPPFLLASVVGLSFVPAPVAAAPAPVRQAWEWPFSATSVWNAGIGSGVVFQRITEPRTSNLLDGRSTPWVNADQYSHPIYRSTTADPVATVAQAGRPLARYRIPAAARPAAGSDRHMHVIDPSGHYVEEAWNMSGANPYWTAGHHVTVDLRTDGLGKGTRAYGGSALAGLIRKWEIDGGEVRHALALSISGNQLRSGQVWPATSQDGNAASTYRGLNPMGTYAAIPGWVNLADLHLSREGLILGRALQRYGAYVVDQSPGTFAFYAEPSVTGPGLASLRADVRKLRPWMRVVANNGPWLPNGGGARTQPAAPPFAG